MATLDSVETAGSPPGAAGNGAGGAHGAPPGGGSGGGAGGTGLSKEFGVANVRAPLLLWVSLGLSAVSFFFHLLAFSMVEWMILPNGKMGLWRQCVNEYGCTALPQINDAYRCVQTFATMVFILMFVTLVLTAVYMYLPQLQNNSLIRISFIVSHGVAAFLVMIAFSVYSGEIIRKSNGTPGGSFGLEVVCFLLELAATGVACLDLLSRRA